MFTSPEVEIVEKMIVYELIDFFSDFGGFIGLFLGFSCVTILDFTVPYLEKVADRKKAKKMKHRSDSIEETTCKNCSVFG